MSASLVGSEMCIRDSLLGHRALGLGPQPEPAKRRANAGPWGQGQTGRTCLLYTSDAADDM
eukprot:9363361-Alexandrium_andersonii.AAC.1